MKTKALRLLPLMLLLGLGQVMARPVDLQTAREVGARFMNANTRTPLRGAEDLQLVTTYSITRGDAAFYVFNTPNGFVIVAADDCATPILGYSDEGRPFDPDNIPIQLQGYLQGFVEQIQYGIENHVQDETTAQQWELVRSIGRLNNNRDYDFVEPLITEQWDQGCYYNAMCPEDENGYCGGHVPTGCGATAMGMIMHYWGYPAQGIGTHNYTPNGYPEQMVNFGETTYDWTNMPDQLTETSTQAEIDAVSTLLWHCGVAINTMYGSLSSTVDANLIPNAFTEYFNYSDELYLLTKQIIYDVDNLEWFSQIKTNLLVGRPIYYIGANPFDGHGFVCDGFDSNDLLHFNWGWGGNNNGYFALYTGIGFSMQSAIFNIYPNCDASENYQISAYCFPSNCGTTLGAGTFSCGQICNLSAIANDGYVFDRWSENGVTISTNPDIAFTIYKDRNLVANYVTASNSIIYATVNTDGSGTISGAGEYEYGQVCTLTATANDGYNFAYWTESGEVVSTASDYSFTVTRERNLVANFVGEEMTCNVVIELSMDGCCSWGGNYLVVDYGDGTSEHFTLENSLGEYYVREVINGNNVTLSWISGELPSSMCFFTISHENGIVIYSSSYGYDQDDLNVTLEIDCIGNYDTHTISAMVNSNDMGMVRGSGTYIEGETCVLTALPSQGYSFAYWTENGEEVSNNALYAFPVHDDRTIVANFIPPLSITVSANIENAGILSGTGVYIYGQECTMSAVPNDGYTFLYWTDGENIVSSEAVFSFRVRSDTNLIAYFAEEGTTCVIVFELFNIWEEPTSGWEGNALVISRDGFFEYLSLKDSERHALHSRRIVNGSNVSLSWVSGNYNYMVGSKFTVCYENGFPIFECTNPGNLNYGFIIDCEEAYLPHVVNVQSNIENQGSISGFGTYEAGETCVLTAIPNEGFTFLKWTENGVVVSTEENYSFPVFADRNLVAHFAEIGTICNIIINLSWYYIWNGNALVVDYGDGTSEQFTVESGDFSSYSRAIVDESIITLSWIPGMNYIDCSFDITLEDGHLLYQCENLNEDFHYVFVFNCDGTTSHIINTTANPETGGMVTGSGIYNNDETATLIATPNESYTFINWTRDGENVSSEAIYSFTVTESATFIANFALRATTALYQGWNWWAPMVLVPTDDIDAALGDTLVAFQASYGTPGDNTVLGEMYRIQTTAPCNLTLNGLRPALVAVTVAQGYNWFGYTGMQPLAIENLSITPTEGDKVISQDEGFAVYNGSTWEGTLTTLQPGHGYVYFSTAEETKTIVFE